MAEIWDLVDDSGERTGVLYRRGSGEPIPKGLYFTVVETWVRVGERVLLTQRHPDKWAGLLWEVSGGGVNKDESDAAAAVRELYEETGIEVKEGELSLLGRIFRGEAMIVSFFVLRDTLPELRLQESEVVGSRWMIERQITDCRSELTNGTAERFNLYRSKIFGK